MKKIKKRDLKDIANKLMYEALENYDVAFSESGISDEDEKYIFAIFKKHQDDFVNKITDCNYFELYNVNEIVKYAQEQTDEKK